MTKQNIKSKEGFTIIEVVLVLAIAGLIFLMVFVALPALQRSQRDTQRRNDLSRLGTALTQWQTNHGTQVDSLPHPSGTANSINWVGDGSFATCNNDACYLVRDYMNTSANGSTTTNTFVDPDGEYYNIVISKNISDVASPAKLSSPQTSKAAAGAAELAWDATAKKYKLGGTDPYAAHTIFIVPGGTCDGDQIVKAEKRRYAVIYRLEGSGTYCMS